MHSLNNFKQPEIPDSRVAVKRSSLITAIMNLICVVKHPAEEETLLNRTKNGSPIIPYYTVNLTTDQERTLRHYLAERLFYGAFLQWPDQHSAVLAGYIGSSISVPASLRAWLWGKESKFSVTELDYLSEWSNPIALNQPRGVCLYGAGVYVNGTYHSGRLSSLWLRHQLGYNEEKHKIHFD